MELILIRHADADSGAGYAEDAMRPLTDTGRRMQEKVAMALHKIGVRPQRVLTSPRRRARETAEITAGVLGCGMPEELALLDGGHGVDALMQALGGYGADEVVVCVGHEPDMSLWGGALLCGGALRIRFEKSAVLGLGFEDVPRPGGATLRYFYRPKDCEALLYKA